MRVCLVRIDAQDGAGTPLVLRLSSVDDPAACHLDDAAWTPAIAQLPTLRYDFFGGAFNSSIGEVGATLTIATGEVEGFDSARLADARFRLWLGELGSAFASYQLLFDGRVSGEADRAEGQAQISAKVDDGWLDNPFLDTYTGGGGLEGPDDIEGTAKPLIIGAARFAPGVLIDAVDNVYQVSAYGALQGITAAYDRLVSLGTSVGNYANLTTLLAATIPPGRWATCLANGLVRLGAPPDGKVCFDVQGDAAGAGGYVRKPGAAIRRIAEIASGTVDVANLAALDTARPWNFSLVVIQQTTARALIQQVADMAASTAGIHWTGKLFVQPLGLGSPSLVLDAEGGAEPMVGDVQQKAVGSPFWRLATQAEPTWSVHELSEIASEYVWRGAYSDTRTYRLDDAITMPDQSAWVYISTTPSAGNDPPAWPTASNTWWKNIAEPVTAANVNYADGTPIEDLKPATPGATKNIPRGNYSAATTYAPGDTVVWTVASGGDGRGYGRIGTGNTTGVAPSDATKWAVYVDRGEPGTTGSTGAPALSMSATPDGFQVPSFANGGVQAYPSLVSTVKVYAGTTDVTSLFNLSIQANPQSFTTTIDNGAKTLTVTGAGSSSGQFGHTGTDKGTITLRATGTGAYSGQTIDRVISYNKLKGGYEIVSTLPSTGNFEGRTVFLDTDGKLYRYYSGAWTSAVSGVDITNSTIPSAAFAPTTPTDNLIINGKGAEGAPSNAPPGWTYPWITGTGSGTFSAQYGVGAAGNSGFVMTKADLSYQHSTASRKFRVQPNKTYSVKIKMAGSGGGSASGRYVRAVFAATEPAGDAVAQTGSEGTGFITLASNAPWPSGLTDFEYTFTVPSGQYWASFAVFNWTGGSLNSYFTEAEVREQVGSIRIALGEILTDHLAAGAVTAAKILVTLLSSISANIGTITAGLLQSVSGSTKLDLTNGRLIFDNGATMFVLAGSGFGSSNQFLLWIGPSQANLNTCTEANAMAWVKTTGLGYWGGAVAGSDYVEKDGSSTNITSSSFVAFGSAIKIVPMDTDVALSYQPFGSNWGGTNFVYEVKWQYSSDGTTYADVSGGTLGGGTVGATTFDLPGTAANATKTGLTAGLPAWFRIVGRKTSGPTTNGVSGRAIAQA